MKHVVFALCILIGSVALAQAPSSLTGQVLERGSRKPIAGASVTLLPSKLQAETDSEGRFELASVPPVNQGDAPYELIVVATEYDRVQKKLEAGTTQIPKIYLERSSSSAYEFTVTARRATRVESVQTLGQEDFLNVPGAGGDPVKAAQNLPGVNRSIGFSSLVAIQGSEPEDTLYQIDGHEVPLVFHFGGLSSVLFAEAVDRVELSSAGYGAEQSRSVGGIVGLQTRDPRTDRTHGLVFVDTLNAGALVEGRVGEKGSYLVGIRQSYIGWVLRNVLKDSDSFRLTAAPQFRDLTALYQTPIADQWKFRLTSFYSRDSLAFLFSQPAETDPDFRGNLNNVTEFYRLIPKVVYTPDAANTYEFSVGVGQDKIRVDAGDNSFLINSRVLSTRAEWAHEWNPDTLKTFIGWDNNYADTGFNIALPNGYTAGGIPNPFSSGELRRAQGSAQTNTVGNYLRLDYRPNAGALTLSPNVRVDYFNLTDEWIVSPRPAVKYRVNESLEYSASGGLYPQAPLNQYLDKTFGNPSVDATRAYHARLGFKKDFNPGSNLGFRLNGDFFVKDVSGIVIESAREIEVDGKIVSENVRNGADGFVFGSQWGLKYFGENWSAVLNYTLSRSQRQEYGQSWTPSPNDQTHVITAIATYRASPRWTYSTRLRFVTGNPNTPVVGAAFDADNDVYIPIRGTYFSERLANFFQLDFRIDRKWTFDTWVLSAYLDIQNLTNRANIEGVSYAYDYSTRSDSTGLPLYPVIGVKGEF